MVSLEEEFPELKNIHYYITENNDIILDKDEFKKFCFSKQRVIDVIEKQFVCGYIGQGMHSPQCRKCKVLKELKS